MTNLQSQLKSIGKVVDTQIKDRIGENLMYQIRNYERSRQVESSGPSFLMPLKAMRLAWKPVGVFTFVGLFFLTIAGLTVVAAQNTMPGDTLFAVKKVIEQSQGLMAADSARRVELAGEFFGNRVNELQQVLVQESQLESDGPSGGSDKVSLAVTEVKKQLDDINVKFERLIAEDDNGGKSGAAVLVLNEKIINYKQELEEVKNKVADVKVSNELDEALDQVEKINEEVLEVIVDKHEKGELALATEELENKLSEHVAEIEEKVEEVAKVIADKIEVNGVEIKTKANQAKEKIVQAREAIEKGEYAFVLTLSKDSNKILEMLYGEINQVVETEEAEMSVPENGEIEGVSSTVPMIEEEIKKVEEEFEVKIQ